MAATVTTHNPMLANLIHSGEVLNMDWEGKWEELMMSETLDQERVVEELEMDLGVLGEARRHCKYPEDKEMADALIESAVALKVQATAL